MKCQICGIDEPAWAYQPFGPDSDPHEHMAILGSHYRDFPVIKICSRCHDMVAKGTPTEFTHKDKRYISTRDEVYAIPDYVCDALLWLEDAHAPKTSKV